MLCNCSYKLQPGERCLDCGVTAPGAELVIPKVERPRLESGYSGPPPTHENLQWLLQFEAAVLSKVCASLVSRSNTLQVSGFLVEADAAKMVQRMAVVKIVLNGKEQAVKVPLEESDSRANIALKITEALKKHLIDAILYDLPFEWQEGGFRKVGG